VGRATEAAGKLYEILEQQVVPRNLRPRNKKGVVGILVERCEKKVKWGATLTPRFFANRNRVFANNTEQKIRKILPRRVVNYKK